MDHPGFWTLNGPFCLSEIATKTGSRIPEASLSFSNVKVNNIRPLDDASPDDVSFFDNRKYLPQLSKTKAKAVFVAQTFADRVPASSVPLISVDPYRAFARCIELFYPEAGTPKVALSQHASPNLNISTHASASALSSHSLFDSFIHPSARLEDNVVIEPGAVIGPEAQIGQGTHVAAGAVIGYRVTIGRDCFIGPSTTVTHSLIGNRVIIHAGARLGQDGFGFAMGKSGHYKVRQVGRVIVQDDVEIGANTTIDRGALRDTVIGEGTKIDNLVQIAHNVVIGRHCVIVGQVGISGSTVLEDFVVIAGQAGVTGHLHIGVGAQIGAKSGVMNDVPAGSRLLGSPAQDFMAEAREKAALKMLVRKRHASPDPEPKP